MKNVKEIVLSGSPYEMGCKYGREAKKEIALSIDSYTKLFEHSKHISWEKAGEICRRYVPAIEKLDAGYVDEMRGVADGAGVRFEDILALNCRSEILHSSVVRDDPDGISECTAFSVMPSAAHDGHVLAGQSWDYIYAQKDAVVMIHILADGNRPEIVFFPEAGMIGGKGMNGSGISLTLNALFSQGYSYGVPIHIRMRKILECSRIHEAFRTCVAGPFPGSGNLMISCRDGLSIDVEMDAKGHEVILPENDILYHTNHFIGPTMILRHPSASSVTTYFRLERMQQLLRNKTDITVENLKALLRDHVGYPTSICAHSSIPEEEDPIMSSGTNFGLIMDLTDLKLYFAIGNPCESEFEEFSFN